MKRRPWSLPTNQAEQFSAFGTRERKFLSNLNLTAFVCLFVGLFVYFFFLSFQSVLQLRMFSLNYLGLLNQPKMQLSVSLSYSSYQKPPVTVPRSRYLLHLSLFKVQVGRVPYACDTAAYRVFSVACQAQIRHCIACASGFNCSHATGDDVLDFFAAALYEPIGLLP